MLKSCLKMFLATSALTLGLVAGSAQAQEEQKKYTFYHLLWSMTDSIVQLHVKAGEAYMKSHPNVEIKYLGPEAYDPAEHARFLDTIINAKPDGIALHISNPDALLPGLKTAREAGIPVVSVTSHPPTEADNKKLEGSYLTWVGADERLIGVRMGERLLQEETPKRVAYLMAHLGHAGHEMRAEGFFASMPDGVPTDKVAVGDEPTAAMDVIRSYLAANPDVGAVFGSSPQNKWITDVLAELGRTDVKVLTSDESPSSLECVLAGLCFATFSQEFPIQGPLAYEIMYQYKETGMAPVQPIVTGPLVIDAANAQTFKDLALTAFGEDGYAELSPF